MTNATSSRPRSGRRESIGGASVSGARVRKSSLATNALGSCHTLGAVGPRPRANTISHIDLASLGLLDGSNHNFGRINALGIHSGHPMGIGASGGPVNFDHRGLSSGIGHHGSVHGLTKLDLSNVNNLDQTNVLRTAPLFGSFAQQTGFDLDQLFSPGTTVNPAQLHFGGAAPSPGTQFQNYDSFSNQHPIIPEGEDFGWMRNWNMQMQPGQDTSEHAIAESSPSRMSSGDSPDDYTESMANSSAAMSVPNHSVQWSQPDMHTPHTMPAGGPFQMDMLGTGLATVESPPGTLSPSAFHSSNGASNPYLDQAMLQQNMQQHHTPRMPGDVLQGPVQGQQPSNFFASSLSNFSSDSPSMSSSSMTGSARQSSVTSMSTDSITDATRQALLTTLSQPSSVFGHSYRKYSQPSISSALSPGSTRSSTQGPNLPSTADIRRYVDAFIQFALPHLPVAHVPTLAFDSLEYSSSIRGSAPQIPLSQNSITGGGGCLILAMAAIGALYEYDHPASKDLFEAARKMIQLYLEERRKADMSAAMNRAHNSGDSASQHTPLWLVQAMLLNVIYGHQCGDKTSADIASNHCAALVSLARAAELAKPPMEVSSPNEANMRERRSSGDVEMQDTNHTQRNDQQTQLSQEADLQTQWLVWAEAEKRKRTLFAIFIISSLLTTAYNQAPSIMNSEILLDLPCDEELWTAETAQEWQNRGGLAAAEQNAVSFAGALSTLLTANQRQGSHYSSNAYNSNNPLGALQAGDCSTENDLRPSTFGCLVLINALHNYIWETRSRHHAREWTSQETESMFAHIEPALNAWQAAWKANDHHKLERPNPFGLGPLSADSIPLLDLAFVRLFVNLGRSKEAFWRRDFDAMADELARGAEIVQHAESSPSGEPGEGTNNSRASGHSPDNRRLSQVSSEQSSSRRERHLRKAAFYAADSLTIASSYNLTYADMSAHELPIQSAMCFFDCSQVLAEWASTVQERVGRYLGVLGRDNIDYTQVPAIMLLESEDVELLRKIDRICESLEAKRFQQENLLVMDLQQMNPGMAPAAVSTMANGVNLQTCGYGSKILRVVALMLEKAVIWPGKWR